MSKLKTFIIMAMASLFLLTILFLQNSNVSAAGSWEYVESMSTTRSNFAVAEFDGKIYVAGGLTNGKCSDKLEEYSPVTDTWNQKANLPAGREGLGLASVNGKLYAIGGSGGSSSNQYRVDEYDIATNTWVTKKAMTQPRSYFAIAAVNDKIYVIGGGSSSSASNLVTVYDPSTDTWETKSSMPTARSMCSASVVDDKIYVMGGNNSTSLKTVEVYDPSSDSWSKAVDMLTSRYSFASVTYDGKIMALGGYKLSSTEEFDSISNTWTAKASMLSARCGHRAAVANGKIYAMGGKEYNGGVKELSTVEAYLIQTPSLPVVTNVSALSDTTSITLMWDAVSCADSYSILLDGSSVVDNITDTSYTITGLSSNSQHSYCIKAVNAGGESNWSSPISISTLIAPPATPVNVDATASTTEITLVWEAVPGADSYSIELDGSSVVDNITDTSYSVTGLTSNTQHSYRVKAVNAAGGSDWSSPMSISTLIAPPATPVNVNATASTTEITLVWDAVSGANSYSIELDGSSIVNNITDTTYTVTGLTSNTEHSYRIKAVNTADESEWSSPVSISTLIAPPATPVNVDVEATTTEITLIWDAVSGADSYSIELDGSSVVNNITTTSYSVKELTSGTKHSYRIKAVNAGGDSDWSSPISISTLIAPPATPVNAAASPTTTKITLVWDEVSGADSYSIELDGSSVVNNITDHSYTITGLTSGTEHSYRIKAVNAGGDSDWSSPITSTTLLLAVPSYLGTTSISPSAISLGWSIIQEADSYSVELDGASVVTNITDNSYVFTGLTPDSEHNFRVKAVNASGESEWSTSISSKTMPAVLDTPTDIHVSSGNNYINTYWDNVPSASQYIIEFDGKLYETNNSNFSIGSYETNSIHTFRVKAKNYFVESEWSEIISVTVLD